MGYEKTWYPKYNYNFNPSQLAFINNIIESTKKTKGIILEVGCAYGDTTIFINKYMDCKEINKQYICIDTFTGFQEKDINEEVNERGKSRAMFTKAFLNNSEERFKKVMEYNNIERVKTFKNDITTIDMDIIDKISFCLFDVDLYRPTKIGLPKLWDKLSVGGVIIVDDCMPNNKYDGALQAYIEFCNSKNIEINIVEEKLGLLYKNN